MIEVCTKIEWEFKDEGEQVKGSVDNLSQEVLGICNKQECSEHLRVGGQSTCGGG